MRKEPGIKEDAQNLTLIGGSACVAALLTAAILSASVTREDPTPVTLRVVVEPEVEVEVVEPVVEAEPEVEPVVAPQLLGLNRLYGTVETVDGERLTGFIRWDRNEGALTDLLDAQKPNRRGGETLSGIRFGHVDRIDVEGRRSAMFLLKSGERVRLTSYSTDLGTGMRALYVDGNDGRLSELDWRHLESIDFEPVPEGRRPNEDRMYGTLTTRNGLQFTGEITWDVDEIYSTDVLDGDLDGDRVEIRFGSIRSIERFSSHSALVVLKDGTEMILDGTNDVDSSISGISVSDLNLGQVKLDWGSFDRVEFHGTDAEPTSAHFDGGKRIQGTVVTESGDLYTGYISWDQDEAYTWEMLDGRIRDIEFDIEFGNIDKIERSRRGATVTLRDGRSFELSDSNDVDRGNRGILIEDGSGTIEVDWDDFRELRVIY